MRIAVLGWGSLIWDKRNLNISGDWAPDGPLLPIEFGRISEDGRLTLIIYPVAEDVQALWAWMSTDNLDEAIENLRERENTTRENIGYVRGNPTNKHGRLTLSILQVVKDWATGKEIDAVIWTDLPENFEEKTKNEFNEDNVVEYLRNLPVNTKREAENYIRRAPAQVRTRIRQVIEERLGWTHLEA